jgi:hypothetical protein
MFKQSETRIKSNNSVIFEKKWACPDLNRGPSPSRGDVIATRLQAHMNVIIDCNYSGLTAGKPFRSQFAKELLRLQAHSLITVLINLYLKGFHEKETFLCD